MVERGHGVFTESRSTQAFAGTARGLSVTFRGMVQANRDGEALGRSRIPMNQTPNPRSTGAAGTGLLLGIRRWRPDWSREEAEATVADYLAMLASELAGVSYNKGAHPRKLTDL